MNHLKALIASLVITGLIACGMFAIGINALMNQNTAPLNDAPIAQNASAVTTDSSAPTPSAARIAQLEDLVRQYQAREQQQQQSEQELQLQLDQANTTLQQYQNLLTQLQARGLIQITNDGRIMIRGGE